MRVHGEKNIAHAAIKYNHGDTVRVALVCERWNMETDARNIANGAMLHTY